MPITGSPRIITANEELTYSAVFRLVTRPYALSATLGAASRTQFAALYHPNTAKKLVRLRKASVWIESASVATILMADLVRLTSATAPASGNPAITPTPSKSSNLAAEATCLALPTTPGSEGGLIAMAEFNLGVTGAAPTANPPSPLTEVVLFEPNDNIDQQVNQLRPGVAEGFALVLDSSGTNSIVKAYVRFLFTEEQSVTLP